MALFAWLAFLLYPPAGGVLALIGLYHNRRRPMPYILIISALLAMAAYWYHPTPEQDLYQYLNQVERYSTMSWPVFLYHMEDIGQLLFFLISRTGLPHLLPALAAFVSYTIALYMASDYLQDTAFTDKQVFCALAFLLGVMSFPIVISVLRNSMAFALVALALYRDLYRRRRGPLTWLLYLLPVFIHVAAVTCLLLRLVYLFAKGSRWGGTAVCGALALLWVFLAPLLGWLSALPGLPDGLMRDYLTKAYNYVAVSDDLSGYVAYVQGSTYMTILRFYHLAVLVLLVFCAWRILLRPGPAAGGPAISLSNRRPLIIYAALLCVLTLGLLPVINPFYSRFFYMAVLFGPMLLQGYWVARRSDAEGKRVAALAAVCAAGGFLNQALLVVVQADASLMTTRLMTSGLVAQLVRSITG